MKGCDLCHVTLVIREVIVVRLCLHLPAVSEIIKKNALNGDSKVFIANCLSHLYELNYFILIFHFRF